MPVLAINSPEVEDVIGQLRLFSTHQQLSCCAVAVTETNASFRHTNPVYNTGN